MKISVEKIRQVGITSLLILIIMMMTSGCKTIPYLPTSSETPYGFVKGDELHRTKVYDKKTGTYIDREDPEVVKFDFDGIAASYSLWKGRDSAVDEHIEDIGE